MRCMKCFEISSTIICGDCQRLDRLMKHQNELFSRSHNTEILESVNSGGVFSLVGKIINFIFGLIIWSIILFVVFLMIK